MCASGIQISFSKPENNLQLILFTFSYFGTISVRLVNLKQTFVEIKLNRPKMVKIRNKTWALKIGGEKGMNTYLVGKVLKFPPGVMRSMKWYLEG